MPACGPAPGVDTQHQSHNQTQPFKALLHAAAICRLASLNTVQLFQRSALPNQGTAGCSRWTTHSDTTVHDQKPHCAADLDLYTRPHAGPAPAKRRDSSASINAACAIASGERTAPPILSCSPGPTSGRCRRSRRGALGGSPPGLARQPPDVGDRQDASY